MIAGAILIAAGLVLAGACITAPGPLLMGAGPLLATGLVLYGAHLYEINRLRRREMRRRQLHKPNRRGGFIA